MTRSSPSAPNTALEQLLGSLLAAPPPPEPAPLVQSGPQTEDEIVEQLSAILEPHDATPAEIEQARADALEIRRQGAERA